MNIYEKLAKVQQELKAPKSQFNKFGGYSYRNAEDILEAVKPLCASVKAMVIVTDDLIFIGNRYYVEATAKFIDTETQGSILSMVEVKAFAREEESKKGMDGSQITGASSSYARKYALNGLFAIDDTKDSDTTNVSTKPEQNGQEKKDAPKQEIKQDKDESGMPPEIKQAYDFEITLKNGNHIALGRLDVLTLEKLYKSEDIELLEARSMAEILLRWKAGQNVDER